MSNRKIILLFVLLALLFSVASVSASENQTVTSVNEDIDEPLSATDMDKLEKTYYYDKKGSHVDKSVVTHDMVKYYGDSDKKFKVTVFDENHKAKEGVEVSFTVMLKSKQKTTDSNGVVYFPVNNKPGIYEVETYIDGDNGFWDAFNKVKIKTTVPTKELVKYSTSKKKFKISFLDTKGKPLKNKLVEVEIKGKTYKLTTNSKGIIKIKSTRFKTGHYKITAKNPVSGEKKSIPVIVLKKGVHKKSLRIDSPTIYYPTKRLKNADSLQTLYEEKDAQDSAGVYVMVKSHADDGTRHTKLIKAKFLFKNKSTGKVMSKTSSNIKYGSQIKVKPVKGFVPYKVTVWYRDKI